MKRRIFRVLVLLPAFMFLHFSCSDEAGLSAPCGTPATVVNLEDGCGFGFQLNDGKRLQTVLEGCEDIFSDYRHEGMKVLIGFEERAEFVNSCNLAVPVRILCLEKAGAIEH